MLVTPCSISRLFQVRSIPTAPWTHHDSNLLQGFLEKLSVPAAGSLKGKPRPVMAHPNAKCRLLICLSLVSMRKLVHELIA
jgi:hypothetical protein